MGIVPPHQCFGKPVANEIGARNFQIATANVEAVAGQQPRILPEDFVGRNI